MWIAYLADNTHEMLSLIFSEKSKQNKNIVCCIDFVIGTSRVIPFLCPATKSGEACYTIPNFECLSIRLSVCLPVCPSALHNFVSAP